MNVVTIKFTRREADALLHRLELPEVFEQVFADTDGMEHLAANAEMSATLCAAHVRNPCGYYDRDDELTRAVMVEAVEGSTWIAVHDSSAFSRQSLVASRRVLESAARKIAAAFGTEPLAIPEA